MVILGGGGLFIDSESIKAPYIWYKQAMACKKFGKPYICYSQSIGPLNSFISRFFTRRVFQNAKAIHFRDKESALLLKDLKIDKEVTVSTDSALFWASEQKKIAQKEDIFLLCLRKWNLKSNESWAEIIEECKNYAKENSLILKLLPMDIRNTEELEAFKNTGLEVLHPNSATDAVAMISKAKILCSMRLHASILALALGTPVLSISYSTKVQSFLENLNVKDGSKVLDLREIDKIQESLKEITGKTPDFDISTPTKKNQEFLNHELQL